MDKNRYRMQPHDLKGLKVYFWAEIIEPTIPQVLKR